MRPVSMLNGDVTDFKNIVVLIHVVSLCHLFELNSADDFLLIQISTGAGSSSFTQHVVFVESSSLLLPSTCINNVILLYNYTFYI